MCISSAPWRDFKKSLKYNENLKTVMEKLASTEILPVKKTNLKMK